MKTQTLSIDEEFRDLIPPLTPQELEQLEANISRDGCRDPLVVWLGENVLIDGHNRYEICQRCEYEFHTVEKKFESREKVIEWICLNQLGRRNLSPTAASELRGRVYNGRKQYHHRSCSGH